MSYNNSAKKQTDCVFGAYRNVSIQNNATDISRKILENMTMLLTFSN